MLRVIRKAAVLDPDLTALWEANQAHRQSIDTELVQALMRKGGLRAGLSRSRATEILSAMTGPESFDLFVNDRSWPPRRWERFVADILVAQLLQ